MGDWNRPRHLVLAVSSKIKVMCHSCIFIVFLIQCIPSHLQHNMRGVYVLAKHSSYTCFLIWRMEKWVPRSLLQHETMANELELDAVQVTVKPPS